MLALKIGVFLLTLCLGIVASGSGRIEFREEPLAEPIAIDHTCHPRSDGLVDVRCSKTLIYSPGSGSGYASCSGTSRGPLETELPGEGRKPNENKPDEKRSNGAVSPLKILYKQKAQYTAEARSNGTQGTVTLRVTFLASGVIGSITTLKGLPFGLTEQAIEAARKIRFEAQMRDGMAQTTTRPVTFNFNLY